MIEFKRTENSYTTEFTFYRGKLRFCFFSDSIACIVREYLLVKKVYFMGMIFLSVKKAMKKITAVALSATVVVLTSALTFTANAAEGDPFALGLVNFDAVLSGDNIEEQNLAKMEKYISDADEAGDNFVVFPEYSLTNSVENAINIYANDSVDAISELAQKNDMYILFGSAVEDSGEYYSATVICEPDGDVDSYYKTHLEDEEYAEGFSVGDDPYVLKTEYGTFGLALGDEFAEVAELGKYYYGYGCRMVLVSQSYSYDSSDELGLSQAEYELYTSSYAYPRMFSRYVAVANLYTTEGSDVYFGESHAITGYAQRESNYPIGFSFQDNKYMLDKTSSAGVVSASFTVGTSSNGMAGRRLCELADWYGNLTDYEQPVYGEGSKYKDDAKVASVSFHPVWGDLDTNVKLIEDIMAQAHEDGVELLAFPEMALTGYDIIHPADYDDELKAKYGDEYMQTVLAQTVRGDNPSPIITEIQELAESYGMYVLVGLPEQDEADPEYVWNSVAILGPDLIQSYRKVYTFNPEDCWDTYSTENDGVFETPFGMVGIAICADIYNYQELQRTYSEMGCRIVINCTAGAANNATMDGSWQLTYQNRLESFMLRDNNFMMTSNLVGYEGPVTQAVTDTLAKYGLTVDDLYTEFCMSNSTKTYTDTDGNTKTVNEIWREVQNIYVNGCIFHGASANIALDPTTESGTYVYGNYTETGVQYNADGTVTPNPYMALTPDTFNTYYTADFDLSLASLDEIYNSNPYSYRPELYYEWYCDMFYMTYGQAYDTTIADKLSGVTVSGDRLVDTAEVSFENSGEDLSSLVSLSTNDLITADTFNFSIGNVSLDTEYLKKNVVDTAGETVDTIMGTYTGSYLPFIGEVDVTVPVSKDAIYYLYEIEDDGTATLVADSSDTLSYTTDGYTVEYVTVATDSITFTTDRTDAKYVIASYSAPYEPKPTLLGDVNLDGSVSIRDVTEIQLYLANLAELDAEAIANADYDENGIVTIADATALQYKLAGK